eukprot:CAMPEP_0113600968 /NCGR_PEP_ID=MMETSP0015_2-20120614/42981_1 /TAXON_ID=2838 /ORGANISM="Odontella" /LENGTH=666 /DNA_ID=CAMNT_0000509243 /DNA_START=368 /DNA_END=2370 /DNA_ORIENTATION=- /assembly_acc=CAM_ASM_000160
MVSAALRPHWTCHRMEFVGSTSSGGNASSVTGAGSERDPPPSSRAETPARFSAFGGIGDPSSGLPHPPYVPLTPHPPYVPLTLPPTGAYGGHPGTSFRGAPDPGAAPDSAQGNGSKSRGLQVNHVSGPIPPIRKVSLTTLFTGCRPRPRPCSRINTNTIITRYPKGGINILITTGTLPLHRGCPIIPGRCTPPLTPGPHTITTTTSNTRTLVVTSAVGDTTQRRPAAAAAMASRPRGFAPSLAATSAAARNQRRREGSAPSAAATFTVKAEPAAAKEDEGRRSNDEREEKADSPPSAKKEKEPVRAINAKVGAGDNDSPQGPGTNSSCQPVDKAEGSGAEAGGAASPALGPSADDAADSGESRGSKAPVENASGVSNENEASGATAGKPLDGAKEKDGEEHGEDGSTAVSTMPASSDAGNAINDSPARSIDAASPSIAQPLATPGRRECATLSEPCGAATPEEGNRHSREKRKAWVLASPADEASMPLRSDFAFFAADWEEEHRQSADDAVREAVRMARAGNYGCSDESKGESDVEKDGEKDCGGDEGNAVDSYLLFSRLNEDLIAAWEVAPPHVRSGCRELEEEDRERVAAEYGSSATSGMGRRQQQRPGAASSSLGQPGAAAFEREVDSVSVRTPQRGRVPKEQGRCCYGGDCDQGGDGSGVMI